ncbi:hypothetical protein Dimus_036864 [Dionaea muscipula]
MESSTKFMLLIIFASCQILIRSSYAKAGDKLVLLRHVGSSAATNRIDIAYSTCLGSSSTIEDCLAGDDEELPAEANKRILQASNKYIGYQVALKPGNIACWRRSTRYSDCTSGKKNPYNQERCYNYTHCRT